MWNRYDNFLTKKLDYFLDRIKNGKIVKKIDELSRLLKKRIIEMSYKRNYKNEEKNVNDAGPSEFVGLMKSSNYVLTNSFHGMVFAIIYGKQFLVFTRGNMNSRIFDLLEILDLRDRVIDLEKDSDIEIEKKMISISQKISQ